MIVRKTTIAELERAPNIYDLLDEYAAESAVPGLPAPKAKVELYKQIEAGGQIQMMGAWREDELIGLAAVISTVLPHYGVVVSVMESLFVASAHRNSRAGLGLIKLAERIANEIGSPGIIVSAPTGGILEKVMPGVGYINTNTAWFKKFGSCLEHTETVGAC